MIETHNLVKLEGVALEKAIETDFRLTITQSNKIQKGYASQVFQANLNENQVFIRINKNPLIFEAELLGYKLFKGQSIPVPEIIAYQEKPQIIGQPTMIMESANGTVLSDAELTQEEKNKVYEEVGVLLKQIHQIKLEGFGRTLSKDSQLVGEYNSWKEYWLSRSEKFKIEIDWLLEHIFITDQEYAKLEKAHDEIAHTEFGKASLLHRDMHKGHIFVENSKVSGVIDLGSLTAGDPRFDVATSLVFQDAEEQKYFKQGYGELANDPLVKKYLAVLAVHKVYFRSRPDVNGNVEKVLPIFRNALDELN